MEQFLAVAAAHFLALLIPGVDFFLIARTSMSSGWRNASGACLGIAAANGVFIAAAFSGVSLISYAPLQNAIQLVGGGFLIVIGLSFLRSRTRIDVDRIPRAQATTWMRNFGLGLASGLLNPKNALFYLSLASAIGTTSSVTLALYGTWMFSVVLVWDVFVAVVLGSRSALARLDRVLPWLTGIAGAFLVLFGCGMVISLAAHHLR